MPLLKSLLLMVTNTKIISVMIIAATTFSTTTVAPATVATATGTILSRVLQYDGHNVIVTTVVQQCHVTMPLPTAQIDASAKLNVCKRKVALLTAN